MYIQVFAHLNAYVLIFMSLIHTLEYVKYNAHISACFNTHAGVICY